MDSFKVYCVSDIALIPPNIKHLKWYINEPIDALQNLNNLTHLTFGDNFDQPIDALQNLNNLSHLTFGNDFNQPIDTLRNLNSLTHIEFYTFYDIPFKIPPNIQQITIFNENDNLFSPLYLNYSEYLVEGTTSIKVGPNKAKLLTDDIGYVQQLWLINETDLMEKVSLEDITYDIIEEFLSPGVNLKPAKN